MRTLWLGNEVLVTADDGRLLGKLEWRGNYRSGVSWGVVRLHGAPDMARVPSDTPMDQIVSSIDWMDPLAVPVPPKTTTRRTKRGSTNNA